MLRYTKWERRLVFDNYQLCPVFLIHLFICTPNSTSTNNRMVNKKTRRYVQFQMWEGKPPKKGKTYAKTKPTYKLWYEVGIKARVHSKEGNLELPWCLTWPLTHFRDKMMKPCKHLMHMTLTGFVIWTNNNNSGNKCEERSVTKSGTFGNSENLKRSFAKFPEWEDHLNKQQTVCTQGCQAKKIQTCPPCGHRGCAYLL